MRILNGGVAHVARSIEEDLKLRKTKLHKSHISGLSDIASSILSCRNVNSGDWISILPRSVGSDKSKERYINRILSNRLIDPLQVMGGFVPEVATLASKNGQTIVLMLDQSKINNGFECLMVALKVRDRAIPIAWQVAETKGAIGFDVQKRLLDSLHKMIPSGIKVLLTADRFYGTTSLIEWCQQQEWQYRIRLKSNLILNHEGGEIKTGDAISLGLTSIKDAYFNESNVSTNIGILQEPGHAEPWIIAMDCEPSKYKILDYSMRWSIECMFSDFKSRGFGITQTHLKHADRIERLILVLAIAFYWAVSTGMKPEPEKRLTLKKNLPIHDIFI
jgi:hypothetical protein